MALKGNLSSANLAEIFQTLAQGRSTGLLRIQAPEGARFVEIQDGAVSIVANTSNRVLLGDLLISRGLIDETVLQKALAQQKESGKLLGQVLVDMHWMKLEDLENALRFQIEEEICDLFLLKSGEFDFLANANLDAKMALGGGYIRLKIDANALLQEAARRLDDWRKIEQRITDQALLFQLQATGKELLASGEGLSQEGQMLLRLAEEHRTVEAMVQKTCLGRLSANLLLTELWDAGLIQPCPPNVYPKAAAEHLSKGRLDESERVAVLGLKLSSEKGIQEALKKTLADVGKKRKLAPGTDAAAAGRSRSEVIRRTSPALILKKKRSHLPWVAAGAALLALVCGGLYWFLLRPKETVSDINRDLELLYGAWSNRVDELIAQRKYRDANDLFQKHFTHATHREKAKQKFEGFKKQIETDMKAELEKAAEVLKGDKEEAYRKEAEELGRYDINIVTGPLYDDYKNALAGIRAWQKKKLLEGFKLRFEKIAAGGGGPAAQAQDCTQLLQESPPEEVAAKARHLLARLSASQREAARYFALAQELETSGYFRAASQEYEKAVLSCKGSETAKKAEERIAALKERDRQIARQLGQLDNQSPNQPEQARDGYIKLLKETPEPAYANMIRQALRPLLPSADEIAADEMLKEAAALEKQSKLAEARKRQLAVLEKYPLTLAAGRATLKVKIATEPSGATVLLNGRSVPDAALADVPVVGPVRITCQKKGFEQGEAVVRDFRGEAQRVILNRLPAQPVRGMPHPAEGGVALHGNWAALLHGEEAVLCDLSKPADAPLMRKKPGGATGDAKDVRALRQPVFTSSSIAPELWAVHVPKGFWRINPATEGEKVLELNASPLARPVLFSDQGRACVGVLTAAGFECRDLASGATRFAPRILGGSKDFSGLGVAFDGTKFYVPWSDGKLYAVDGKTGEGWDAALPPEPLEPPAWHAGALAVLGAAGKVTLWGADSAKPRAERELGARHKLGLLACGKGFAALSEEGKLELLAADGAKTLWTQTLAKEVAVLPVAVGEKFLAVAAPLELVLLNVSDGSVAWRSALFSPPVALATDAGRIVLSTQDASLLVFETEGSE